MADAPSPAALTRRLTAWFRSHSRDLPWRVNRTGYAALVSEAMLQQTQVSRVVERFEQFMDRFPTVEALAAADEQDVLTAWRGLGYYRRARHLHAAARAIVDEHGGSVPDDVDALEKLPGVGRYTAGAIASIVFGRRVPVVDGNVQRVLARWFEYDEARPDEREAVTWTWRTAASLVEQADDPGAFNEAVMELGALICSPRRPACDTCPVREHCAAHRRGRANEIPPPKQATVQQQVHHHAVAVRRGNRWLIEQRGSDGLWSRMWQVPTIETGSKLTRSRLADRLPVRVQSIEPLTVFDHQTTHRRIRFHVFCATSRSRRGDWRTLDEIADLPLSVPQQRIVAMLDDARRPAASR